MNKFLKNINNFNLSPTNEDWIRRQIDRSLEGRVLQRSTVPRLQLVLCVPMSQPWSHVSCILPMKDRISPRAASFISSSGLAYMKDLKSLSCQVVTKTQQGLGRFSFPSQNTYRFHKVSMQGVMVSQQLFDCPRSGPSVQD